jgi:hypothetical protein
MPGLSEAQTQRKEAMKFPLETVVVSERSLNITDADCYDIAHDIEPEHAAFIVLACNSFDALTEANKKLVAALKEAQIAMGNAKASLDAGIATGAPVHPVSASLTWPLSTVSLVLDQVTP